MVDLHRSKVQLLPFFRPTAVGLLVNLFADGHGN
jgi:hypothetical protein